MLRDADGPIFSFEFFPPRSSEGEEVLLETVGVLKDLGPSFVSVTYGAGGTTRDKTIEVVSRIRAEFELEAMPHLTCVNATVDDLRRTLDEMGEAGVENVLALRGDPPRGQERWTKTEGGLEYSRELVELVRDEYDFTIGGAAFPETHIHADSPDDDVRHLKAKVDAGATFLITQMFFDNRFYFDFVERAREAGVEAPIIPGVMPILSSEGVRRMAELSAAHLPPELVRRARGAARQRRGGGGPRPLLRHAAVRRAARGRRARDPLLHAQPHAGHSGGAQRAAADEALGALKDRR